MSVLANHAGEGLILAAAAGGGLLSGSLIVVRAGIAKLVRRRGRRHP